MRQTARRRPSRDAEVPRSDPVRKLGGAPVDAAAQRDREVVGELRQVGLHGAEGPVDPVHGGGGGGGCACGAADDVGGYEGEVGAGGFRVDEGWDDRVLHEDLEAVFSLAMVLICCIYEKGVEM